MNKRELILVCGISGAGKTVTMDYLDSAGYYCIDNLPILALFDTLKALKVDDTLHKYAIAINSNAKEYTITETLIKLKIYDWLDVKVLYLDVSDEVLLKRFQITRKAHPLTNQNETLLDAIEQERKLLSELRQHANLIIDTTDFSVEKLKDNLSKIFNHDILPQFRLSFVSFGYKYGMPQDLDYAFDVRFISNPYYINSLQEKTGNDNEVYEYVMSQPETIEFIKLIEPLLDFTIEKHKKTSRSYLVIGIGCTGGKHRSVSLVNYLTDLYSQKYNVIKDHREIDET